MLSYLYVNIGFPHILVGTPMSEVSQSNEKIINGICADNVFGFVLFCLTDFILSNYYASMPVIVMARGIIFSGFLSYPSLPFL